MRKGFTLIELIIVLILFFILTGFVAWTFIVALRSWNSAIDRAGIRQDASFAMEIMVRELSQANSFTIAQEGQVKFDADIDDDGADEGVTYSVTDNELTRKIDGTTTILSTDVQTFTLLYRDSTDAVMDFPIVGGDRDEIRVVVITLTTDRSDETLTLSSSVYTRNQS